MSLISKLKTVLCKKPSNIINLVRWNLECEAVRHGLNIPREKVIGLSLNLGPAELKSLTKILLGDGCSQRR